jgi:hypothetical protein
MAFMLIESAKERWRAVNAPHVAHVRAGGRFERGVPAEAGGCGGGVTPEPAEHARFHGYVRALSQVSDADECDVVAAVLRDPDRAMADSAVLGHLDCCAAALDEGEAFADRSHRIAPVLDGHELSERRLREWSLLKEIDSGQPWSTADLVVASDWLQLRVAERAGSREALAVVAEHGRTSRIRNTVRSRLDRQPG